MSEFFTPCFHLFIDSCLLHGPVAFPVSSITPFDVQESRDNGEAGRMATGQDSAPGNSYPENMEGI